MKQINVKKLLLPNIPYVFIALFATKLGQAARLAPGADFSQKALHIMEGFAAAFQSALPSFHPIDLCVGIAAALLIRLAVYVKGKNARKFRKNIEYGSARWGNAEDIKPYVDPTFANNVILTQTERLTMNSRPKDPKTARNKNVLVVGGSGSGKTRFFIKPNLMQLHSSYVVTDPKGSIVVECGKLLQRNQYKIKILNTINFKKSHHYNPFAYLHSEKDILKLVTTLIANTQGDGKSGDDFWRKAETLLYTALIGYIYYEAPVEEQNFATLIEMINTMEVREDDEDFKNPVDLMFEELAKREPHHFAVRQYAKYRLAAGKTAKSILISCGARLAPFDIQELREITSYPPLRITRRTSCAPSSPGKRSIRRAKNGRRPRGKRIHCSSTSRRSCKPERAAVTSAGQRYSTSSRWRRPTIISGSMDCWTTGSWRKKPLLRRSSFTRCPRRSRRRKRAWRRSPC